MKLLKIGDTSRLLALSMGASMFVALCSGYLMRAVEAPILIQCCQQFGALLVCVWAAKSKYVTMKPFRIAHMKPFLHLAVCEALYIFAQASATRQITAHVGILVVTITCVTVSVYESQRISSSSLVHGSSGRPLTGQASASALTLRVLPWISCGCALIVWLEANWAPWATVMFALSALADVYPYFIKQSIAQAPEYSAASALIFHGIVSTPALLLIGMAQSEHYVFFEFLPTLGLSHFIVAVLLGAAGFVAQHTMWQLLETHTVTAVASLATAKKTLVFLLTLAVTFTPISLLAGLCLCVILVLSVTAVSAATELVALSSSSPSTPLPVNGVSVQSVGSSTSLLAHSDSDSEMDLVTVSRKNAARD